MIRTDDLRSIPKKAKKEDNHESLNRPLDHRLAVGGGPSAGGVRAGGGTGPGAGAGVDTSGEEYIYVSMMGNLEFFNAHKYGWEWAGDTLGVTATYVGPPDFDVNAQVAAFDQAIAKNPKGIVVFGVDPSLIPEINKASEAGIPVVTILGDLPDVPADRLRRLPSVRSGIRGRHRTWPRRWGERERWPS